MAADETILAIIIKRFQIHEYPNAERSFLTVSKYIYNANATPPYENHRICYYRCSRTQCYYNYLNTLVETIQTQTIRAGVMMTITHLNKACRLKYLYPQWSSPRVVRLPIFTIAADTNTSHFTHTSPTLCTESVEYDLLGCLQNKKKKRFQKINNYQPLLGIYSMP